MVPGLLNHANALARGGHWVDAAKVYDHLVKLQPGFLGYEQGLERALAALRRQGGGRVPQVSMAPGAPIHALETRTLEVLLRHGLVGPGAVSEIRHPPAMEPDLGLLTLTAALRYGTAPAAAAGWARALDAWLARWAACRLQPLREAQFSAIRLRALGAGADGGPKVTVAMSCFNNAQTVEAAVVSVLGQTHRNLELVIVQSAATATAETSAPSLASPQSQRLRLPPVLPIVLYNGRPRWSAATDVADLIEPPPGRLARFTPRMSYLLLDEGAIDETGPLALKNLAAALFHLDKSRTPDTMQAVVGRLMQWLNQPEQDSLRRAFTVYILRVLLPSRAPGVAVPQVANLLELRTMLAETVLDWKKQWLEEGEAKGKAEGKAEGKRDTLTRLLTRRFGPLPEWVAHRLSAGTVEQLDVWSESVLDAATLAEVFGGH